MISIIPPPNVTVAPTGRTADSLQVCAGFGFTKIPDDGPHAESITSANTSPAMTAHALFTAASLIDRPTPVEAAAHLNVPIRAEAIPVGPTAQPATRTAGEVPAIPRGSWDFLVASPGR